MTTKLDRVEGVPDKESMFLLMLRIRRNVTALRRAERSLEE